MEDGVTPATIERDINGGWSDPCHKRKGPKEVREATTTNERASPVDGGALQPNERPNGEQSECVATSEETLMQGGISDTNERASKEDDRTSAVNERFLETQETAKMGKVKIKCK